MQGMRHTHSLWGPKSPPSKAPSAIWQELCAPGTGRGRATQWERVLKAEFPRGPVQLPRPGPKDEVLRVEQRTEGTKRSPAHLHCAKQGFSEGLKQQGQQA